MNKHDILYSSDCHLTLCNVLQIPHNGKMLACDHNSVHPHIVDYIAPPPHSDVWPLLRGGRHYDWQKLDYSMKWNSKEQATEQESRT
jgi:hypothetical protein